MPRGGARPGAGRPKGRRKAPPPVAIETTADTDILPPRPRFETAREFGLWALNADDSQVTMDQKVRTMQALLIIEKQAKPADKPQVEDDADVYAPRKVRSFSVVK